MLKDRKEEAREILETFRSLPHMGRKTKFDRIREEARRGGFSLADIGTSEEELEELWVKGCRLQAQISLDKLRRGSENYMSELRQFRRNVFEGCLFFEEFGTSEAELEKLRRKGWNKVAAQELLSYLRRGPTVPTLAKHFEKSLREELHNGGFSLADIGTSEEELASLQKVVGE